jgi:hypothetical protein
MYNVHKWDSFGISGLRDLGLRDVESDCVVITPEGFWPGVSLGKHLMENYNSQLQVLMGLMVL